MSSSSYATVNIFSCDLADAHCERRSARKSASRRALLTPYEPSPYRPDSVDGHIGVSFAGCEWPKAVRAHTMNQLEGSVGARVCVSTLVDPAAGLSTNPRATAHRPTRASPGSMCVEYPTPSARISTMSSTPVTPVHRTRSRGKFRTSQVSGRSCSALAWSSATAGSGWPERHRSHFERLGARLRPTLGTAEPSGRPDRGKWLQGSPAESGAHGRCRVLQAAAPCARKLCDTEKTLGEKVVIHT